MSENCELEEHLTDGRKRWQWQSRYPHAAWNAIILEFIYILFMLAFFLFLTFDLAAASHKMAYFSFLNSLSGSDIDWCAVFCGGICGGCTFAFKWLYHGVAHGRWHLDRTVWRYVVPILSGVVALFTGLMISAGIVPIFNDKLIDGARSGAAFGFFAGFFSDNVLAALQRVADQTLGTLASSDEKRGGGGHHQER